MGFCPLSGSIKNICIVLGAALGYFLIKQDDINMITCYGTSFIGSFMFFHGLGSILGGFPSIAVDELVDTPITPAYIGYLAGILAFAIGGGYYQKKKAD